MRQYREKLLLALGLLSVFFCPLLGIVVWGIAGRSLQKMDAGEIDSSGRDITSAARIFGIIAFTVSLPILVYLLAWISAIWGTRAWE